MFKRQIISPVDFNKQKRKQHYKNLNTTYTRNLKLFNTFFTYYELEHYTNKNDTVAFYIKMLPIGFQLYYDFYLDSYYKLFNLLNTNPKTDNQCITTSGEIVCLFDDDIEFEQRIVNETTLKKMQSRNKFNCIIQINANKKVVDSNFNKLKNKLIECLKTIQKNIVISRFETDKEIYNILFKLVYYYGNKELREQINRELQYKPDEIYNNNRHTKGIRNLKYKLYKEHNELLSISFFNDKYTNQNQNQNQKLKEIC